MIKYSIFLVLFSSFAKSDVARIYNGLLRGMEKQMNASAFRSLSGSAVDVLNGYGCWCYFESLGGHGPIQDVYDELCKTLQNGYECCVIDDPTCEPWTVDYNSILGQSGGTLEEFSWRKCNIF